MTLYWSYLSTNIDTNEVFAHLKTELNGAVQLPEGFVFSFVGNEHEAAAVLRESLSKVVPEVRDDEGRATFSGSWFTPVSIERDHRWMDEQPKLKGRFDRAASHFR